MKVIYRKNDKSQLTYDQVYIVLGIKGTTVEGVSIYVESEKTKKPVLVNIAGFEFVNQKGPSSWVPSMTPSGEYDLIPQSWKVDHFFSDLEAGKTEAVMIYEQERDKIYQEMT